MPAAAADESAPLALPSEDAVDRGLPPGLASTVRCCPSRVHPGSGKTYTGARLIVDLLAAGKKVGITANSHKVICNLLKPTVAAAKDGGVALQAVQKVNDEDDGCNAPGRHTCDDNADVIARHRCGQANLVAGTAWLWSRAGHGRQGRRAGRRRSRPDRPRQRAGRLARRRRLVLLGDPQQLNQPTKGVHPPGAAGSALEHLLDGAADHAARARPVHPRPPGGCTRRSAASPPRPSTRASCAPCPGSSSRRVTAPGRLTGTGLRFVPVAHAGNQNESPEEVGAIARLLRRADLDGDGDLDR